jgi:hypothetical protein
MHLLDTIVKEFSIPSAAAGSKCGTSGAINI